MLRIRLVGELRLELDGRPLTPIREPTGTLAAGLAGLHPGLHPRTRVAAVFWPDVLETARAPASDDPGDAAARARPAAADLLVAGRDRRRASRTAWRLASTCARSTASSRRAGGTTRWRCATASCSPTSTTTGCWRRARPTASGWASCSRRWGRGRGRRRPRAAVRHARRRLELDPLSEDAARALMQRLGRSRRRRGGGRRVRDVPRRAAAGSRDGAVGGDPRAGRELRSAPRRGAPEAPLPDALARPRRTPRSSAAATSWPRCGARGAARAPAPPASCWSRRGRQRQDAPARASSRRGPRRGGDRARRPLLRRRRRPVRAVHRGAAAGLAARPRCRTGSSPSSPACCPSWARRPRRAGGRAEAARHRLFEAVAAAVGQAARSGAGAAGRRGPALGRRGDGADCSGHVVRTVGWAPLLVVASLRDDGAGGRRSVTSDELRPRAPARAPRRRRAVRGRGRRARGRLARERAAAARWRRRSTGARGATRSSSRRSRATSPSRTPAGRPTTWSRRRGARCPHGVRAVIDRRLARLADDAGGP